jgi:hypothetical protein
VVGVSSRSNRARKVWTSCQYAVAWAIARR